MKRDSNFSTLLKARSNNTAGYFDPIKSSIMASHLTHKHKVQGLKN